MRSDKMLIVFLALLLILTKCGSALYMPAEEDAKSTRTTLDSLLQGRKLYVYRCSGCHSLHLPEDYSADEWRVKLDKMEKKAELNTSEKESILRYLTTKSRKQQ
jgi:hypothetical protein